jgi:hypothetical protein
MPSSNQVGEVLAFNVNDNVRVRLTDAGRLHHRRQHDKLRREYPSIGRYRPPKADAEGYTSWQLWDLMKTFGPIISMGSPPPFEMDIRIDAALLRALANQETDRNTHA